MRYLVLALPLALVLAGCHQDGSCPVPEDMSSELYVPGDVLEVSIEMEATDWEFVRKDVRNPAGVDNFSCPDGPFYSHYTWKPASVTVNGQHLDNIGVRKKGSFGSLSTSKPGLKLKFDEYESCQELNGQDRLTLNNNISDPAFVRQCFTYAFYRQAGLPAPRCNFARVTVNGRYLGLYSNIEPIDKSFLRRNFGDDSGDLYEGAFSDYRQDWYITFEEKTDNTDVDRRFLQEISDILMAGNIDIPTLAEYIDVSEFATYWALEMALGFADGYSASANNFFVYFNPDNENRMVTIPWGADTTMQPSSTNNLVPWAGTILPAKLYQTTAGRKQLLDALAKLLENTFDELQMRDEINALYAGIATELEDEPEPSGGSGLGLAVTDSHAALDELLRFVSGRKEQLQAFVDNPPPVSSPLLEHDCQP